jgi:hypothetical protein
LWIDAICINQDDLSERSREVGNMDSIYCNANQVLVWLGSSSQNSALALQTLCRLGEGIDFNEKYYIVLKPGSWADQISYDPEALKSNAGLPSGISFAGNGSRDFGSFKKLD